MITVTSNSPQQINAALLALNKSSSVDTSNKLKSIAADAIGQSNINLQTVQSNLDSRIKNINTRLGELANDMVVFGGQYVQPFSDSIPMSKTSSSAVSSLRAGIGSLGINIPSNGWATFCSLTFKGWKYYPSTSIDMSCPNLFLASVSTGSYISGLSWNQDNRSYKLTYTNAISNPEELAAIVKPQYQIYGGPTGINNETGSGTPAFGTSATVSFVIPIDVTTIYLSVAMNVTNDDNNAYIPDTIDVTGFMLQRISDIIH
jgi:hypothetical protein